MSEATAQETKREVTLTNGGHVTLSKGEGSTKVEQGGKTTALSFEYEYVNDENGKIVSLADVMQFMLENGYKQELPTKEEQDQLKKENEGMRGKVAEPRSITRCLLSAIKDYNYMDARNTCLDEATNTEAAQFDRAINSTIEIVLNSKSPKVAQFGINNIVGLADDNKALAVATLDRLSKHSKATDFVKGLALNALAALTD